ncbi:hypothetical protein, partial [uncultured Photobacterium sp.]|uniref:hypothetical protein n=1 Tax=uncultured Photobacterium sp. TaxID=173973 RepID=UPI00261266E1
TEQPVADGQHASESQPMHLADSGSQSAEPTSPQQEAGFVGADQTQLASADVAPMTTADDQLRPGNEQTSESEPVQLVHAGSEPRVMQNSAPDDGMADAGQQLLASADEQALQYASTTTSDSEGAKENYEEVLNPSFVGDGSQSMLDPDQGYASTMIDGQGSPLDPDGDVSIS